jgi:hypothetical protein
LNLGTIERTIALDNQAFASYRPLDSVLAPITITAQPPLLVPLIAWSPHLGFCSVMVCIVIDDHAKVGVHVELQVAKLRSGCIEVLPTATCASPKLHLYTMSGPVVDD